MVEIYVIRDLTRAKKCKIDDWGFEYIQGSSIWVNSIETGYTVNPYLLMLVFMIAFYCY